ncbi:uncharacterized protein LOC144677062 isoform X2 [Cetorhinus maximus]
MAASERIQNRRRQCIFRLAFQHCPLRKLARKLRGMPAEPSESISDRWHSFSTVSENLASHEGSVFNQLGANATRVLPQPSIQTLSQGPPPPAFPLPQIQVELNREPSPWSMDMEVDPETGERA